jgi:adenine-specific DNA methylase
MGLLLPDPCHRLCPDAFKPQARSALSKVRGTIGPSDQELQHALLQFIGDFSSWHLSSDATYLDVARRLIQIGNESDSILVADPFAGRGSIPLEALRLGCDAFGSDLNPVACFILRILLEAIPRRGPELAEQVDVLGKQIQDQAEGALSHFYPPFPDGEQPVAYLWSRTVRCESPDCGTEIPIFKSPWLAKRGASRARYFRESTDGPCVALLVETSPRGGPIQFRIATGYGSEDARTGYVQLKATKAPGNNANVVCPACGAVLPGNRSNPRVPIQLANQRGGADVQFDGKGKRIGGARLLAIVTRKPGERGQRFRLPTVSDYEPLWQAKKELEKWIGRESADSLSPVPYEETPRGGGSGAGRAFSVQRYGMMQYADLFNSRQLFALVSLVKAIRDRVASSRDLLALLAAAFTRVAMSNMSCTRWNAIGEKMQHTFGRQALPIVWDYAEIVPTADAPGNWKSGYQLVIEVIDRWREGSPIGQVELADACGLPLPRESVDVWFTDPPYYDAVPYSDLADFFFVWLKRLMAGDPLMRDPFDPNNPLTPKTREIVQDETREFEGSPKDSRFFEELMGRAFGEGRQALKENGIGCVVFAHKTTEGWEALLSGMIQGGWTITASWPIATEMTTRLRARESAALATSVHLVCRPRRTDAPIGDWAEVLRELPSRVADWMERLEGEGVRGADLVFACIGPALEIFSRYSRVETAEGSEVPLPQCLDKVWEVVGRTALEQVLGTAEARARNSAAGALEEDARLTALFLWTLQATEVSGNGEGNGDASDEAAEDDDEIEGPRSRSKGFSLIFDVVRRFAQPLGIHLPEWEGRVINTEKGVVRLIPVLQRGQQLFGKEGAQAVADRIERVRTGPVQLSLFPESEEAAIPTVRGRRRRGRSNVSDESLQTQRGATTLDRVHAAMLLQASGRAHALRALLKSEIVRGSDFIRLANALSALYPKGSDEKRLLDAMLLAVPR